MSIFTSATQQMQRVLRSLALAALAAAGTLLPLDAAFAGVADCMLVALDNTNITAGPSSAPTFRFTFQRTSASVPDGICDGATGVVATMGSGAASVASVSYPGNTTSSTWQVDENDIVTVTFQTPASADIQSFAVECNASAQCMGGDVPSINVSLQTVLRSMSIVAGDGQSGFAGEQLTLQAQALDDGTPAAGPVPVQWAVTSGNATVSPASSLSTSSTPAQTTVTLGNGGAGLETVTISATRPDAPEAAPAVFQLTINQLEMTQVSPAPGAAANAGDVVPLVVELEQNGSPMPKQFIQFSFASNPNGSTLQGSGPSPQGAGSSPAGMTVSAFTGTDGRATVNLTVGQPNSPPANVVVQAVAYAGDSVRERIVSFSISATDVLTVGGSSGNGQSANVGEPLPSPLVVNVTRNGATAANTAIDWTVSPAGAATLSAASTLTDVNGVTQVQVTSVNQGGPITIAASPTDDPSVSHGFAIAGNTRGLDKPTSGSGDGQTGSINQAAPQPLVAIATLNGAAQPGITIVWTVQSGSGTVTGSTNPTDSTGRSTAQITFGPTAGPVIVQAARSDVTGVTQVYEITSTGGATAIRTLDKPATNSGDGQSGPIGSTLPQALTVIANNDGSPVAGITINWSVSGNANLDTMQSVTGNDGRAQVQVSFGNSPGTVTVTAARADEPNATSSFVVTAIRQNSAVLQLEHPSASGDGVSGPPGTVVTLRARALRDTIPDANVDVFWELVSGSATLGRAQAITGSDGIATTVVTLGPNSGTVQVRATRGDAPISLLYTLTTGATGVDVLSIVDGNNQGGAPGSTAQPLQVRLTQNGQPVANATVEWSVVTGSGTVASPSTLTDADGNAQVGFTFGTSTGPVQVRAVARNISVSFQLTVEGAGTTLRLVSGNRQTGPIGSRADQPIVVEVTGGAGDLIPGQPIEWEVVSGTAVLDRLQTVTGEDGRSSQGFSFGSTAGAIRLRARLPGSQLNVIDIEATGVVPTLSITSGNDQTGAVSQPLAEDFVVTIAQPAGLQKSLAGVTIRWAVSEGGGTLASATSVTDASGRARNRLTLGPQPGANRATAGVDGGGSVTFTATAGAQAGAISIVAGNSQALPTNTPSAPLVVEVRTTSGQPASGVSLLWTATNATPTSVRTVTDASGRSTNTARVILPGAANVTVEVESGTGASAGTVTFALTAGVSNLPGLDQPREDIANAIDNACPALVALANPSPAQLDLRARCLELINSAGSDPTRVEDALLQLQDDVALAQANAALVTTAAQFDNVKARIAALRSGASGASVDGLAVATSSGLMPLSFLPSAVVQADDDGEGGSSSEVGADFSRWGFFASGIIGRGKQDRGSVTPEYDFDTNGITAGIDYRVNDVWIVGASLGYSKQETDVADDAGGIDTSGWSVSGYTTMFRQSNWYLDGVLTYGSNDYDLSRRIAYDIAGANGLTRIDQVAEASSDGTQLSGALSFGRDFQQGAWSFGPYFRGTYTRVEFDSYAETLGAGAGSGLGLAVDERDLKSMTGVLGGKATYAMSRDWGILMPHMQVEWEHEFKDDPQNLVSRFLHDPTSTPIRMQGDDVDTDYFNLGLGLSALFPGGKSAFFYYEHLAGSEGLSQDNLSLGVRFEF